MSKSSIRHKSTMMQLILFAFLSLLSLSSSAKFPDRSTNPVVETKSLKIMAELPARPGNIAVDPRSGRVFFTFHPFGKSTNEPNIAELLDNFRGFEPFGDQKSVDTALALRVAERKEWLIVLDHKHFGAKPPAVLVYSIAQDSNGELLKTFEFPEDVAGNGSFLNDFVISKDEDFLFIADTSMGSKSPSIITVDMKTWTCKKALVDHESTRAKPTPAGFTVADRPIDIKFEIGVDSIALSPDGKILYFAAVFDQFMWQVPTKSLIDGGDAPENTVDIAFPKTVSDGIVIDDVTGVMYLTDFEHSSIWMTDPTVPGRAKTLVQDNTFLRWPDGLCATRGWLWITASALDELMSDPPRSVPPYNILRVQLMRPVEPEVTEEDLYGEQADDDDDDDLTVEGEEEEEDEEESAEDADDEADDEVDDSKEEL